MYIHYTILRKDFNTVSLSPLHPHLRRSLGGQEPVSSEKTGSFLLILTGISEELLPLNTIAAQRHPKINLPVNQCHPAFFEHALGGGVLRVDQADDLIEAAIREAKVESGLGCLGGIAVAPQTSQHNR
jgi:hypothetical protein